jgi:hypothetical protein
MAIKKAKQIRPTFFKNSPSSDIEILLDLGGNKFLGRHTVALSSLEFFIFCIV